MNYSSYFDSWSPIFDDRGLPLVGKIEFCEANTTDYNLKTVYDVDGQPIDNPVYCNVVPSTQIILGEGDYTVRYYKYIGSGNMESDNNETNWHLYKTELLKGADSSTSEVGATEFVDTIAQLKNIEGMANGQKVVVLGYNEAGDCPSRVYTWIANSSVDDDGGIKINSLKDNTGHWRMSVPGTYIDVRWYNDFPDSAAKPTTQTSNLGQRSLAASAANDLHKDLYFPNTKGRANCYYIFDGSNTVSVTKDIICDNGVRFVVKGGTVGTKVSCHELKKCEKYLFTATAIGDNIGSYAIEANWINSSWFSSKDGEKTASGARVGYVIDYLNSALDFADTKIKIERNGLNKANVGFRRCEFVDCYKNIDKSTIFQDMEIKEEWFNDSFDFITNCSYSNCKINLDNFSNGDTYIKMKNKNNQYDYGDLNEEVLHNAPIYPSGTLENCGGSIVLQNAGYYELRNAGVSIYNIKDTMTLNLVDCWATIPADCSIKTLHSRRGTLQGNKNIVIAGTALHLDDVVVDCKISSSTLTDECTIKNCELNKMIELTGNINPMIINNDFYSGSGLAFFSGSVPQMNGTFDSNYFYPGSNGLGFGAQTPNTIVNVNWTNNHSEMATHFIAMDRTNFNPKESAHTYSYDKNSGPNTIVQNPTWTDGISLKSGHTGKSGIMPFYESKTVHGVMQSEYGYQSPAPYYQGAYGWERVDSSAAYGQEKYKDGGLTDINVYTTECTMFTVGTDIDDMAYTLTSAPANFEEFDGKVYQSQRDGIGSSWTTNCLLKTSERPFYASCVGTIRQIMFYSGYTFRLMGIPMGYIYNSEFIAADPSKKFGFMFHIDKIGKLKQYT